MSKEKQENESEMEKTEEELIIRTMGYGYLKAPKQVRKKLKNAYNMKVENLLNPIAYFKLDEEENFLEITYKFDLSKSHEG